MTGATQEEVLAAATPRQFVIMTPSRQFLSLPNLSLEEPWEWVHEEAEATIFESFSEFVALIYNSVRWRLSGARFPEDGAWILVPVKTETREVREVREVFQYDKMVR